MQIHELNNFSGELGSGAFVAVDNGNDTGKVSTAALVEGVNGRVDNMINSQQNESVTTLWTGALENYNQQVALSEDVSHFDFIDIYVSYMDYQFIRRPANSVSSINIQSTNLHKTE